MLSKRITTLNAMDIFGFKTPELTKVCVVEFELLVFSGEADRVARGGDKKETEQE